MKKIVVEKSKKNDNNCFYPGDLNTIWYKKNDRYYTIWPYYCNCSYFINLHYCHHLLALIRLNIAKIILNPNYVAPAKSRKLVTSW